MISIVVADDQALVRQGIELLLKQNSEFNVVGTACDGETAIQQIEALKPNIALIDISMPRMNGIEATQIISQRFPFTKVLILSSHDDEERVAEALNAGAKGYLLKNTLAEKLSIGIHSICEGYYQIGPGLLDNIFFKFARKHAQNQIVYSPPKPLTKLLNKVEKQLNKFDCQELTQLVCVANENNLTNALIDSIEQDLAQNPNNLALLYLVGLLCICSGNGEDRALHYLNLGFQAGISQNVDNKSLLSFYHLGSEINAEEAFRWLSQINTPWIQARELIFLIQEAKRIFSENSTVYKALFLLKQIESLESIQKRCIDYSEKIDFLTRSLEQVNNLSRASSW